MALSPTFRAGRVALWLCFPHCSEQELVILWLHPERDIVLSVLNMRKLRHREAMVPGRHQCSPQRFCTPL